MGGRVGNVSALTELLLEVGLRSTNTVARGSCHSLCDKHTYLIDSSYSARMSYTPDMVIRNREALEKRGDVGGGGELWHAHLHSALEDAQLLDLLGEALLLLQQVLDLLLELRLPRLHLHATGQSLRHELLVFALLACTQTLAR